VRQSLLLRLGQKSGVKSGPIFPRALCRAIGTRGHQRISAKLVAWPLLAGTNEASDLLIDLQISWRSLWFRMDCSRS